MSSAKDRTAARLARSTDDAASRGLGRTLPAPGGLDACSNDVLGLSRHPAIQAAMVEATRLHGAGAGASRLVHGPAAFFEDCERAFAAFAGQPSATLFSSGYAANVGLLDALFDDTWTVFSDALNHASLIDGLRLSGARRVIYPHLDLEALGRRLASERSARPKAPLAIVTESLFSMDGDSPDLARLMDLAEAHDAIVIVDEAHATGLFGKRGSGRLEAAGLTDRVFASVHTGGKALGVGGAFVAGGPELRRHLIAHARSFVFSTAPLPALAAGLRAALELVGEDAPRRADLARNVAQLRRRLAEAELDLADSVGHILPLRVGSPEAATAASEALREAGFDVRAIRPPTVPAGTSRLRVVVHATWSEAEVDALAGALVAALGRDTAGTS